MKRIFAGLMGLMLATTAVTALAAAPSYEEDNGRLRFYANGNAIILDEGTTTDYTVVYVDNNKDGAVDAGDTMVEITGATGAYDATGYDLSDYSIFGGANTDLTANTQITMLGGTVGLIYGANYNSDLTGNVIINLQGGEVLNQVYGGGVGCNSVGDVEMTYGPQSYVKWVGYAGGVSNSSTTGNVTVNVDSMAEVGRVFVGGNDSTVTSTEAPIVIGDTDKVDTEKNIVIDSTTPTETPTPTPDPSEPPVVTGGTIVVEQEEAMEGEEVMVDIVLEDNPGLAAMKLTVDYDETALEFVSVDYNAAFDGEYTYMPTVAAGDDVFNLNWVQATNITTEDITYATITFKVIDDTAVGVYDIDVTYDSGNVINSDTAEVSFAIENGSVEVVDFLFGDVTDDGLVNNKDVFRLLSYIPDNTVVVNMYAADVNGDGEITNADVLDLFAYVSTM